MKTYSLLLTSALLLGGCTHTATSFFSKDDFYEKSLHYSAQADILNSMETKAHISATYLGGVDKQYRQEGENFVIGIYITNDSEEKNRSGLSNPDFILRLNETLAPIKIIPLAKEEALLKNLPYVNNWSRYYRVIFPQTDMNLSLSVQSAYSKAILKFPKAGEE